ncbi:MAG: DegV family EDD domain-containing protein, partial [Candidatus Heimdallarchaeota archaeon]|nr:DegV family EDD domain-containing protein [Candidatus Heimdallarchaeota archaeon]
SCHCASCCMVQALLTEGQVFKHGIALLEILVEYNEGYKKEITEIDREEFTENLHLINPAPKTSFASPDDALSVLKQAEEDKYDAIIYPFMTPKTSNQVNSVRLAAKKMKDKIKIEFYPTQYAGASQAAFVLYAQKMLKENKSIEEITNYFDKVKPQIYTIGFSKDFTTLFQSGKVKKSVHVSLLTNTLKLKPIYHIPLDEGVIGFGGGIGFKGALKKIIKEIESKMADEIVYDLIISHSNGMQKAEMLEAEVRKVKQVKNCFVWKIPPAIVNSVGKGATMVTLYPNYEKFKLE